MKCRLFCLKAISFNQPKPWSPGCGCNGAHYRLPSLFCRASTCLCSKHSMTKEKKEEKNKQTCQEAFLSKVLTRMLVNYLREDLLTHRRTLVTTNVAPPTLTLALSFFHLCRNWPLGLCRWKYIARIWVSINSLKSILLSFPFLLQRDITVPNNEAATVGPSGTSLHWTRGSRLGSVLAAQSHSCQNCLGSGRREAEKERQCRDPEETKHR